MQALSRTTALVAILLAAFPAAAQAPSSIAVRVTASESGAPLPGAQLTVRGALNAAADAEGWARLENVPAGMHMVQVRHIGYATEQFLLQFSPGAALREQVVLEPDPVALAPVAVSAARGRRALESRGFYSRRQASSGVFMDRDDIERIGHGRSTVSTVLRSMQGVRLRIAPHGRGFIVTSGRTPQIGLTQATLHCFSRVIVDGVPIQPEFIANNHPPAVIIDRVVSLDEIEAMEWYRGAAQTPAEFNQTGSRESGSDCGTLVIWTRSGNPQG